MAFPPLCVYFLYRCIVLQVVWFLVPVFGYLGCVVSYLVFRVVLLCACAVVVCVRRRSTFEAITFLTQDIVNEWPNVHVVVCGIITLCYFTQTAVDIEWGYFSWCALPLSVCVILHRVQAHVFNTLSASASVREQGDPYVIYGARKVIASR